MQRAKADWRAEIAVIVRRSDAGELVGSGADGVAGA
jgi:hypothetical protein